MVSFQNLVENAKTISVDPNSCIPFSKVRHISQSGIQRLMHIFRGAEVAGTNFAGVSTTGNLPTVVELSGEFKSYPIRYFTVDREMTDDQASEEISRFSTWYGIIDGSHRNAALRRLAVEDPEKFSGFPWTVLVLNRSSMSVLRAFARNCNEKQKTDYCVQSTVFDKICSLKEDARALEIQNGGKKLQVSQLVNYFSGGNISIGTSTLKSLAKVALRLSDEVVKMLGLILNHEDGQAAMQRAPPGTLPEHIDYRVYRKIVSANTFRMAKAFFQSSDATAEKNQMNALLRLKNYGPLNDFKPVSGAKLDEFFVGASNANLEVEKFEEILSGQPWPPELQVLRSNMLTSSILDKSITMNKGNSTTVLPELFEAYRRAYPNLAEMKIFKWKQSHILSNIEDLTPTPSPVSPPSPPKIQSAQESISGRQDSTVSSLADRDEGEEEVKQMHSALKDVRITALNTSWRKYETDTLSPDEEMKFDAIISSPPELEDCVLEDFSDFMKRRLCPGGSVILFVSWARFPRWLSHLSCAGFRVMSYPFIITPTTSLVQRTRCRTLPQQAPFPALIAFAAGVHPAKFQLDLKSGYLNVRCTHKRKFAVIDNAPVPRFRLLRSGSKQPFSMKELSPILLADLMDTFVPREGAVLDPYAGAMSLACSAVMTGRSATVLEVDEHLFQAATSRLVHVANAKQLDNEIQCEARDYAKQAQSIFDTYYAALSCQPSLQSLDTEGGDTESDCENTVAENANNDNEQKKQRLSINDVNVEKQICSSRNSSYSCHVDGCTLPPHTARGHSCQSCGNSVHAICRERILNLPQIDTSSTKLCSSCHSRKK